MQGVWTTRAFVLKDQNNVFAVRFIFVNEIKLKMAWFYSFNGVKKVIQSNEMNKVVFQYIEHIAFVIIEQSKLAHVHA